MSIEKRIYNNGLSLYVDHLPNAKVTAVSVSVPYGSLYEEQGQEGAAHALEHCVFIKTPDFKNETDLNLYEKINGMHANAYTDYTQTVYTTYGITPEPIFHYLSQVLQYSQMPKKAVAKAMGAVRREALTRLDSREELHYLGLSHAMFGAPYGRSIIGYHDKLHFTAKELHDIYKKQYLPGVMSMIVVGATPMEEAAELLSRHFSTDDDFVAKVNEPPAPTYGDKLTTATIDKHSNNLRLSVAYTLSKEFKHKLADNRLVYSIAGSAISNYCYEVMRLNKAISYDGGVWLSTDHHPNAWTLGGNVTIDPENIASANQTFDTVFSRSGSEYTNEQILGSIASGQLAFLYGFGNVYSHMSHHAYRLARGAETLDYEDVLQKAQSIEPRDVRDAIDEIVTMAATRPRYEHRTGKKNSVGIVDGVIDQSELV